MKASGNSWLCAGIVLTAALATLALNPGNTNGAEQLRKLRSEEKPK